MKQQILKTMFLLCAVIVGSASAWATDIESNFAKPASGTGFTVGDGELSWTATNYKQFESSGDARGLQSEKNTTDFVITSDATQTAALGTIKKIVVYCSANAASTVSCKVGGTAFGTQSQSIAKNTKKSAFTFSGTASGTIVITISRSSSSTCWINKVVVTYGSSNPEISATNVTYDADETEGEIAYAISNPVEGKVLTASTTADWITLGTVTSSAVPFTMTENTGALREGTVTLAYGDNLATKDVKVTQAAAVAKYAVTFAAPANGTLTVKRDGVAITSGTLIPTGTELTIETEPARGYSLTNWQYKVGAGEWTDGEGSTYTVTAAVELRANFAEIAKYTVTLKDDDTQLTEEYGGEGVTLPTRINKSN